jgi:SNF2 family DNA or RNA helicase
MEQAYELYEDQENAVNYILEHKDVLLKAPTGAGKTIVAVESAIQSGAQVVLAIIPLNTVKGWRETVERQSGGTIPFHWITSKKAGKEAHGAVLRGEPGWYVIGREYFKRFGWSKMRKADFIILDECHVATNKDTAMFKMLRSAKAPHKLAMSATPFGNKVQGAWSLSRWLWPDYTERRYLVWITEFFHTTKNYYSDNEHANPLVESERVPGSVWKSLKHKYRMKSVYKADPAIHVVEVEVSAAQRKHYQELEQEAITWLDDHPLAVDLPIVLATRLHQILLAVPSIKQDWVRKYDKETETWNKVWDDVVYFDDDAKSTKADVVLEILSDLHAEEPVPVVVYTSSRIFATLLTKRLQAKKYRARQFIGGMSPAERDWKKDSFGTEFDIIVCTIPTVAEGLDGWQLFCHNEIWVDVSANRFLNIQAQGRLSRTGQTKRVNRWLIQTANTIESKKIGKLKSDQELMDAAIEEREDSDTDQQYAGATGSSH